ncbi:hypothetical protein [Microbispora catharanthi]|uniref:Uncharacterized protein n=1 Tax=Microbispora catharanthi TaxID=1712871 RepID=A0A5N6BVU3_9ACTN|nr:hypothetical protein [Microbispora catharanthi]KAB8184595.1 hypothetical protein FH610_016050 [Microbispora catharanthi]
MTGLIGLAICMTLAGVAVWFLSTSARRAHRMLTVLGNATQVAHPEYRMRLQPPDGVFSLTLPLSFERQSSGDSNGRQEVVENALGDLTVVPSFPSTDMTGYLREFAGGKGVDPVVREAAEREVRGLGKAVRATALVELTRPLAEPELVEEMKPYGFGPQDMDKYFFMSSAVPAVAKPVFWSALGGCAERGLGDCDERSATKQFQQWVGSLADDDRHNLRRLGLDLKVLRDAAADGHVYGFVVNWMTREDLLGLLGKPDVRNVYVVEAVPHSDRVPH